MGVLSIYLLIVLLLILISVIVVYHNETDTTEIFRGICKGIGAALVWPGIFIVIVFLFFKWLIDKRL